MATSTEQQAGPTAPSEQSTRSLRRELWGRRVLMTLLVALVAAALVGLLGVHARTVSATGGGYDLSVRYAATARPGISVPLEVEVTHDGGFSGPVTLAVSADYLQVLQVGSSFPEASESTADGDAVELTFDPPDGDTLSVTFQAQVDPSADPGRPEGAVALLESGDAVVTARFRTWVLP
jgi:hypothetical protein